MENPWSKKKPNLSKQPGQKGTDLGKFGNSRRDFLKMAGAAVVGMGALKGEALLEEWWASENIESYKGIKIPKFVNEKPTKNKEKFIPKRILELVDKAKEKLKDEVVEHRIVKIPVPDSKTNEVKDKIESHVSIAVMDLNDTSKIEILKINPQKQVETEGYQVQVGDANLGVGTGYEVTVPNNFVVLATKRMILRNDEPFSAIYSPHTPDFDVPLIRRKGFRYLVDLLEVEKTELKKVKSRVPDSKEIAPGVPLKVALLLSLVEQVDPGIFKTHSEGIQKEYGITKEEADMHAVKALGNRGLTVVGLNRTMARNFSVSAVGAPGLFQLMPDTYRSLAGVKLENKQIVAAEEIKYKDAGLNPDFLQGATDHKNAARAAWLLLDSNLYEARNEPFKDKLREDPDFLYKYLAACYNAGSKPVRATIRENPNDWVSKLPDDETRTYVRIFTALNTLFGQDENKALPDLPATAKDKKLGDRNRGAAVNLENIPFELRGSAVSMARQRDTAEKTRMEFIKTRARLDQLTQHNIPIDQRKNPRMVPLPEKDNLILVNKTESGIPEPERRYCTPETAKFLLDMAEASKKFNSDFEPIMINSGVRPDDVQQELKKTNPNAVDNSPHSYGSTIDIAYNANSAGYRGMSQAQMDWTRRYLIEKEKLGLIEATQEIKQTVFHIMVFKDYLKPKKK